MVPTNLPEANPDLIRFPKLNLEFTVHSNAFTVFGQPVTWYGVLITIGMMLAMIYGFARMRKFGIDSDRAIDGVIGGVIGAIIGARAYYVLFHLDEYSGNWKKIFNIREGGLAIYGGIIGALLVGSIVCKLREVRLLPMFDLTALGLLIGQCIGRWGNFMNHEAFGSNTDSIFGMTSVRIDRWITNNPSPGLEAGYPVHPCFLYESAWCLLGFLLLHLISKKWRKFDGQIFLMYIVWYGAGRFFIEGLRTDSLYLGTVKISQALALVSVAAGLVLLIIGFSRTKRLGTDYQLYVDTEESKRLLAEADQKEQEWQEKHSRKKKQQEEESTHVLLADDDETKDDGEIEAESVTESEPAAESEAETESDPEKTEPESVTEPEQPADDSEEDAAKKEKAEKDAKIDALLDELASAPKKKKGRKKPKS